MKRTLLILIASIFLNPVRSQEFSARDLFNFSSLTQKKFEAHLSRNKFILSGSESRGDTLAHIYIQKTGKNKENTEGTHRVMETCQVNGEFSFAFSTTSADEFAEIGSALKNNGFYTSDKLCNGEKIYQKENITITAVRMIDREGNDLYRFRVSEANLPDPGDVIYAEDLLPFQSHEHLVAVFGEENVIKDVYYFTDKDFSKSSVLFPRTRHQAVFIWEDEENYRKPLYVMIGGNMNTGSSVGYNGVIEESAWHSKAGIYAGMSLANLVRLNGEDLKFYGKNSDYPFMVVPKNNGSLDLKTNNIILACLNPGGSGLLDNPIVSANEILNENPGMYVFMLLLNPSPTEKHTDRSITAKRK